jgi:hypothetical protein
MEVSVNKRLNETTSITIKLDDEKDLKEAFLKLTPFLQMNGKCGLCNSDNISIQARKTKDKEGDEFIYLELYCKKCHAKQGFGEYKQPKGALFLKGGWEIYTPKEQQIRDPGEDL